MAEEHSTPAGPDLAAGIAMAELADGGKLVGHVGGKPVLLVRRGAEIFAVGADVHHYGGPLAEGWWWATPSAAPGTTPASICGPARPLRAPALSPLACWSVEAA